MNKKELIEELKQNIPDFTGTEEEKELKTALYVLIWGVSFNKISHVSLTILEYH